FVAPSCSSATGAVATANVGSYTINCLAGSANNYTLAAASVPNAFTVGARTLNITANDDSKTYGATKSYAAGSTAFLSSGLQNSETIGSVTITASGGPAATDEVGSYDQTPSAATGGSFTASNYDIHYFKGTLT